ncbi:rhodanese-like domain-containing protein [Pedobacter sp. UYP1]|uniref:rhodanese-like domain-containing protein n=1 Tax=Pedobacter sp. UYP1 TaxID=1756396 RepID=UPI003392B341
MLKNILLKVSFSALLFIALTAVGYAQTSKQHFQSNPWKEDQLISPAALAGMISKKEDVKIYNIGVVQNIKGATNLGAASEAENLNKLKEILKTTPKNKAIVIYCGCCPMDRCPNIRPAFKAFVDQDFTNVRLLELPTNIKTDWIDQGYPVD